MCDRATVYVPFFVACAPVLLLSLSRPAWHVILSQTPRFRCGRRAGVQCRLDPAKAAAETKSMSREGPARSGSRGLAV